MKFNKIISVQIVSHQKEISETLSHFVKALNYGSDFAKRNHIYNTFKLQKEIYHPIREKFQLRSQMAVNCCRKISGTYKLKKHKERATPIVFKKSSMLLNYPRDYSIKTSSLISLNTIHGRKKVEYKIGIYQKHLLDSKEWLIRSSTLFQRRDGKIFLQIGIEKEIEETTMLNKDGIVGVDVGIRHLAVSTDTNNETIFYGKDIRTKRRKYFKLRQELQRKGTRSAKRKLRKISGRERRFVRNQNHIISKQIVLEALKHFKNPIISLENLKGIRKNNKKNKQFNRELNNWGFYQLQQFIEYKALEKGIPVIYIKPKYTSQECPKCHHREKNNRIQKLHLFKCKECGYQTNDDRSASIIIRNRALVSKYISETKGICQLS